MSTSIIAITTAIISDALSAAQLPGGAVVSLAIGEAIERVNMRRKQEALSVLEEELRLGNRILDISDLEGVAAIAHRFVRAAQEGTARLNLRMLAAIFAGQTVRRKIVADEFLHYADKIASLSYEELVILAKLIAFGIYSDNVREMAKQGIYKQLIEQLVPATFEIEDDFASIAAALQRTGFVVARTFGGGFGDSTSTIYAGTSLLKKLNDIASVEGVLARETHRTRS